MILFNKVYAPVVPVPFTRATKEAIWEFLKSGKTPVQIFKDHNVPLEDLQLVIGEIERLEAETFQRIKGTFVITPAVVVDGVEITPAVYAPVPATRVQLASSMTSPYVILGTFTTDLMVYYPTYDEARTWAQFKLAVQNS